MPLIRFLFVGSILIFAFSCLKAQESSWYVQLAKEPINRMDQGMPRVLFVQQIQDGFFVMREHVYRSFKRRKFFVDQLDVNLNTRQTVDITDILDEQNFEIRDVVRLNDRLLILSTKYLREQRKRAFFLQELVYETLEFKERVEVYRMETESSSFFRVELIHSPDEKTLMFSVIPEKRIPLIGKPENDYREIVLLNNHLFPKERIGRLEMHVGGSDFFVEQSLVDDNGVLYFLASKIPDKKSEEPVFHLLRYRNKILETGRMDFSSGQINRARIDLNPDGSILFMGYYSELKRFNPGVGVVSTVFSKETLEPKTVYSELIKNEVMMSGLTEREKRKWQREIQAGRDLKLNQDIVPLYFFRHPSGQVTMVGEIQYVNIESTSFTQAGAMNRYTYNYEHIFATRIDSSGKILWTIKIPKLYRGSVDLIQSFHALMNGEGLNVIFNDNINNLIPNPKKGISYLSSRTRNNFVVNYEIDANGNLNNSELIEYAKPPFDRIDMLNMFTNGATSNNNFILFSTSGRLGYYYLLVGRNKE
jgi:hypothetical protein